MSELLSGDEIRWDTDWRPEPRRQAGGDTGETYTDWKDLAMASAAQRIVDLEAQVAYTRGLAKQYRDMILIVLPAL